MLLVDTSVLIDFLKGTENTKSNLLKMALNHGLPYGIASYTYQEVLQGAKDEREYKRLNDYLSTQKIYFLPENIETYERAANMYFSMKRHGITIRNTIDILIALTAIEYNLVLLHNDRDFDFIADNITDLKTLGFWQNK